MGRDRPKSALGGEDSVGVGWLRGCGFRRRGGGLKCYVSIERMGLERGDVHEQ
jgi:hypothetical protein